MDLNTLSITKGNLKSCGWKESESGNSICWMYDPANDPDIDAMSQGGLLVFFDEDSTYRRMTGSYTAGAYTVALEDEDDFVPLRRWPGDAEYSQKPLTEWTMQDLKVLLHYIQNDDTMVWSPVP